MEAESGRRTNSIKSEVKYEEIMNKNESEFNNNLKEINLSKNKENDEIKCINNLITNKNHSNYLFFIKYNKFFQDNKNSFDKNNIEKIFNNYKDIVVQKKEDNQTKKIINGKENDITKIKIFIDFFKVLIYIYENENEIDETSENINFLGLKRKKKFKEFFNEFKIKNELKFITLHEKLLTELENKKTEFKEKDEIEFYEYLFLTFNYYKNNLNYLLKENFCENIPKYDFQNIYHLENFILLFTIQNKEEIINEMIHFLFNMFKQQNLLNLLYRKIKDAFINSQSINIIKLYKYIINEFEKGYIVKRKSLYSLCKKKIFTLKLIDKIKEDNLKFYGNTTINEIYDYLTTKFGEKEYYFDIILKERENNKLILDESYLNKTLNELNHNNLEIVIIKKEINQDKLIEKENGNKLTEKLLKALIDCFNFYSKRENIMNRNEIAECWNKLSDRNNKLFTDKNYKIIHFLKKYSNNFNYITKEDFIKYYNGIILENNEKIIKDVWNNIKNMNFRFDLKKIPQEIKNDSLPRYFLSNETNEFKDSCLMNIFNEKFKTS